MVTENKPMRALRIYLTWTCGLLAVVGVCLAFFADAPLFRIYSEYIRDAFFSGGEIPAAADGFRLLTYGQLGGTMAGLWAMLALICRHGLRRNESWVAQAVPASIFVWFVIDSAVSLYYGAAFTVWLFKILPVFLVVPPMLLFLRVRVVPIPRTDDDEPMDNEFTFWYRWMLIASILPAAQGVFTAIFASPDPFHIYANHIRDFYWNGPIPKQDDLFRRFLLGPLGAALAGYFTVQYFLVRFAWKRKWKWGRDAIAAGLLIWFTIDSTVSIMHGVWFNLYLVNVPTLIAVGAPILATRKYFS